MRKLWPIWLALAIMVVAGIVIASQVTLRPQPVSTTPTVNPRTVAIAACRDAVRAQLKSPTSAKFSGETAQQSGSIWKVKGNVDADNSFGASIRNAFSCNVDGSMAVVTYLG